MIPADQIYIIDWLGNRGVTTSWDVMKDIRRYLLAGAPSSLINTKMTMAIDVRDWFLVPIIPLFPSTRP